MVFSHRINLVVYLGFIHVQILIIKSISVVLGHIQLSVHHPQNLKMSTQKHSQKLQKKLIREPRDTVMSISDQIMKHTDYKRFDHYVHGFICFL